ncbi:hypothetical protein RUM44_002427 [Polyplax serrata]|uniref:Uncharacterized protein n=1 Tax=Polyplax serrata TaxID=468196 RepID=A0ABR1AER2_POLSC
MIEKVILGFEAEWWMPDACLAMRKKPQNGQPEADGREVLKKFKEDSQDASNGPGLTVGSGERSAEVGDQDVRVQFCRRPVPARYEKASLRELRVLRVVPGWFRTTPANPVLSALVALLAVAGPLGFGGGGAASGDA